MMPCAGPGPATPAQRLADHGTGHRFVHAPQSGVPRPRSAATRTSVVSADTKEAVDVPPATFLLGRYSVSRSLVRIQ
jgi:hypothetical protein